MKFKAIVIDNQNEKFTREVKEIDKESLKDGNVLVKVEYSSLNYKDAMILKDGLLFAFCYGIFAVSFACYKFYLDNWRDEDED